MDIALFDRHRKSCVVQHHSKARSSQRNSAHDKRRPLSAFLHGRPLNYARAPRSRMQPLASKPSRNMKQMISSIQQQTSSDMSESALFQFDDAENEDFANSRFRFVIRNGPAVDLDGEVPWERVEHVRVPTFDTVYACPICLDSLVAARITRCGHVFCFPCILHHLHDRPKCRCPLCFAPMQATDLRSMEFVSIQPVHVGDDVKMCLLTRNKSHTHPNPVDPSRTATFSRFVKTDSIADIVQKDLRELKLAADSCQCAISAAFINEAIAKVDYRVSSWDLVSCETIFEDSIDLRPPEQSPDEAYFFYQSSDGSPVFMHSLNYRSIVEEYGDNFPSVICGKVLEVVQYEQTDENRSRFRFLRHLPLSMVFYIVELNIDGHLSEETIAKFREETISRQTAREAKKRQSEFADQRQKQREVFDNEKQSSALPLYKYDPFPVPEVGSIESFPSLSSTPPHNATSNVNSYHQPRWTPNQNIAHSLNNTPYFAGDDSEPENEQLLHSATPPDWNLIDFQITTKTKQKKQRSKSRGSSSFTSQEE